MEIFTCVSCWMMYNGIGEVFARAFPPLRSRPAFPAGRLYYFVGLPLNVIRHKIEIVVDRKCYLCL